MELDELLLQTGADVPFAQARLTIHQPRLKEIAFMMDSGAAGDKAAGAEFRSGRRRAGG